MAGKNNFYPYGESSTNILNNSEYQTDQERTAGAARGAIARSKIYNKALRQGAAGAYAGHNRKGRSPGAFFAGNGAGSEPAGRHQHQDCIIAAGY